ncbi:MAG: hypothetical protein E7172_05980 [Firmicutes bacterium]|nr:hypothetical protein [Bacillota bacterium]
MKNKNNISVERMVELENWLLDNYPYVSNIDNIYSLFLSNFNYDEANYLNISYRILYQELINDLYYYWTTKPQLDELRFIGDLSKKYKLDTQFILQRIKEVKMIRKYLKNNPNALKSIEIQKYNKLVRDNIPNIIENNDGIPVFRTLDDKEYWNSLLNKIEEETNEVANAITKEERKKELADLFEILKAMAEYNGFTLSEIEEEANIKRNKNGGFTRKLYLEKVIEKMTD